MNKLSSINTTSNKINNSIIENISCLVDLKAAVQEMISNPTEENFAYAQQIFEQMNIELETLRNSIFTLAKTIVSEDGDIGEVDVLVEENGTRLI